MLRALYSFGLRLRYNALFGTIMYSQVNAIFLSLALRVYLNTFSSQRLHAPSAKHLLFRILNGKCVACCHPLANMEDLQGKNYLAFAHSFQDFNPWISIHQYEGTRTLPVGLPNMLDSLCGNVRLVLNIGVPASSNFLPSMHIRNHAYPWVELYAHCLCKRFAPDHCPMV